MSHEGCVHGTGKTGGGDGGQASGAVACFQCYVLARQRAQAAPDAMMETQEPAAALVLPPFAERESAQKDAQQDGQRDAQRDAQRDGARRPLTPPELQHRRRMLMHLTGRMPAPVRFGHS